VNEMTKNVSQDNQSPAQYMNGGEGKGQLYL